MDIKNALTLEEVLNETNGNDGLVDTLATSQERTEYIEVAPNVKLYVRDCGEGKPVILIHGWPLCNEMWEYQINDLVENGYRVIAYDRRGFGKSSQPWDGYDYDTLASDLKEIIDQLKLEHVSLVGFSMGGGEVVRYFSRYGGAKISKAVLISSVIPYMLKTDDNPSGVPQEIFDEMADAMKKDRIAFLTDFGKKFFGVSLLNNPLSDSLLNYYTMLASVASPKATLQCANSFSTTDFRSEISSINVPVLIIHGNADKTVPIESSSDITATLIPNSQYIVYDEAPHGLFYTDRITLNADLIQFLNAGEILM